MTCAQGLLRLLWGGGGPKLECYVTEQLSNAALTKKIYSIRFCQNIKLSQHTSASSAAYNLENTGLVTQLLKIKDQYENLVKLIETMEVPNTL